MNVETNATKENVTGTAGRRRYGEDWSGASIGMVFLFYLCGDIGCAVQIACPFYA